MRHLGGKPALLQTKLCLEQARVPSLAFRGSAGVLLCTPYARSQPNIELAKVPISETGMPGCPDTGGKSAPELGMPSREDSSWKVSDIISGGSLDVKNVVFTTEAGQGAIPGPQESHHPLISFFCSITAEHHLVLNSFFHEFPRVLAPLSLSTNASLKIK